MILFALACSGEPGPPPERPVLRPSSPALPSLQPIDPHARGATYLTALGGHIQPRWGQFLEDCRLRLPGDHPLNIPSLTADVELVIDAAGKLEPRLVHGSGNADFDAAALEVLRDVPATPPPDDLESDDGRVHVHWVFARDRRQAGPATAKVIAIELPLVATVQRLVVAHGIVRAARRLLVARPGDPERLAATELVMIAALREGLASADGATRQAALEAVARAGLAILAPEVHALIAGGQVEQRAQAVATAAALGDPRVVPVLADDLVLDLAERPELALAKLSALVTLGARADAARAIAAGLAAPTRKRALATAIAALAIAPDPKRAAQLATWFARGDAEVRQAVCAALPAAAPTRAAALITRGLQDADASVRAACVAAATRGGTATVAPALLARLTRLARDRDEAVRASAIAALGLLAPTQVPSAARHDRAPRVRAAAAAGATEAELDELARDPDADVRAAAIAALVARPHAQVAERASAAARDPASQVQRAAIAGITDDAVLEKLAGDDDPEVATAALTRYAERRGRSAVTVPLLARLVVATPKSLERVRIARSWLLAR